MLGWNELKGKITLTGTTVECPVKGCSENVKRQKKFFRREDEFKCPKHNIYISPTTFEYQTEWDNLLWKDALDRNLFKGIKKAKRERRIARERSEDALTWNVFRFLERNNLIDNFLEAKCGSVVMNPEVIYWSYCQSQGRAWDKLLNARVMFGEAKDTKAAVRRGSEPDIIVKSDRALFFIEAKLTASNNSQPHNQKVQTGYTEGGSNWWSTVFASDFHTVAIDEKKYELARFWLLGSWIAQQSNSDFYLINLVRSEQDKNIEETFEKHIKENQGRTFMRITWENIYDYILTIGLRNTKVDIITKFFRNKTIGYTIERDNEQQIGRLQKAFLFL